MKLYADNHWLAEQLLETAFALLRNEGLQPADCLIMAWAAVVWGSGEGDDDRYGWAL